MKELWLAIVIVLGTLFLAVFIMGAVVSICIFFSKVWEHVNQPQAFIKCDTLTTTGPTEIHNMDFIRAGKVLSPEEVKEKFEQGPKN